MSQLIRIIVPIQLITKIFVWVGGQSHHSQRDWHTDSDTTHGHCDIEPNSVKSLNNLGVRETIGSSEYFSQKPIDHIYW